MTNTATNQDDKVFLFDHGGTTGAILRILPDATKSLNQMLPEDHQQVPDQKLKLSYTCCYLLHQDKHVLIDAGIDGDEVGSLLTQVGVSPSEIELVCITHVDRDHVAGLLLQIGDGELAYPNAQYAIDAQLWADLREPETYERLPKHLNRLFRRLKELIEDRVILCEGEMTVMDAITFIPCPGHRPGHAAYAFATATSPILHLGDAVLHPVWIDHPDWPAAIDSDPSQAMQSRDRILQRASDTSALTIGTHIPWPGIL